MTGIKRVLAACLLLIAMLAFAACAQADSLIFGLTYRDDVVNLRSRATSSSTKLASYPNGTWMHITGESGNWYRVTAPDGRSGYMSKNYVEVIEPPTGSVGVVTNQNATAFLNLREYPSYDARVLGIYYNGVPCVLMSEADGWYHVRVDGKDGYFRREYLRVVTRPFTEEVATIVTPGLTALNLRTGPGKNYGSIRQYAGGSYVMVVQKGSGWWKVAVDGYVGYMDASFLRSGVLSPSEAAQAGGSGGGTTAPAYAIVTNPKSTQVLNMRERPSTTSKSVAQYRNGTRLTVLEQGTEWCRVMSSGGLTGFMMTRYLTLVNLPGTPIREVVHPRGSYVNLRSMPNSYSSVRMRVPNGAIVTVLTPDDSWVQVRYNGAVGYMSSYFLE